MAEAHGPTSYEWMLVDGLEPHGLDYGRHRARAMTNFWISLVPS